MNGIARDLSTNDSIGTSRRYNTTIGARKVCRHGNKNNNNNHNDSIARRPLRRPCGGKANIVGARVQGRGSKNSLSRENTPYLRTHTPRSSVDGWSTIDRGDRDVRVVVGSRQRARRRFSPQWGVSRRACARAESIFARAKILPTRRRENQR